MSIKRQDIVNAVETRMKTILTTGGYHTNAGTHVYVWRQVPIEPAELPAIVIRDMADILDEEEAQTTMNLFDHRLEMSINVVGTNPTAIRQAVADIYKAIGTDIKWSGLALNTSLERDEMVSDQDDKVITGCEVKIAITYRTNKYQES